LVLGETLRRDPLGITYRARDLAGGQDVALTLYQSAAATNQAAIDRFQDAMLVAAVDHPAVLSVDRVGRWRAQVAVTRRLVYAPTLGEAFPRGMRCDLDRALEVLRPIADALDAVHGAGVVHGDLRPESVMLTRRSGPLLVGCGVAEGLDLSAVLVSTLERRTEWASEWLEAAAPYLAPERWRGAAADPRSDQYGLAAIAFRILTGDLPFAAEHVAQVAELHRIAVIPRASSLRPGLGPSVDVALTRALAKVAAERFTTTRGFVEALAGETTLAPVVAGRTSQPQPIVEDVLRRSAMRQTTRPLWRPPAAALVTGAVLLAAGVIALLIRLLR